MTEATNVLNEVYGFDLHVCDQSVSNKQYIVINILPYMRTTNEDKHTPKDGKQIIILLVLTHVFMSNDNAPEETIFRFLQSFELDLSIKHELFGNIKDFIRNDMVKQRYLSVSVDEHTRKISYSWGTRAETDVSKAKILQFVCNTYGNIEPSSWTNQFKMANIQIEEQNDGLSITTGNTADTAEEIVDSD
ncbi:non-structural maintenance of chromosomes element 3 homolog isoform X2 [Agrilus planipennis]|nr:non-structural maintenance of chromosomes element 3 homolog isoform X2 [Agrilus planipennis]